MKSKREQMVREIRVRYGLTSPKVLSAMLQVPRHKFVSKENQKLAYRDSPVPIGCGQTMSQPFTVTFMTDLIVNPRSKIKNQKVLEIGTGSGYQAALLSKLFKEVYTIEIVPQLAKRAKKTLNNLGYKNVHVRLGSGEWGWEEKSPYDAIMITAGVEKVPNELFKQLKVGGVLVAPVGKGNDKVMTRFRKTSARRARFRKKSQEQVHPQKTSARQARLRKATARRAKQPSNQVTKLLKEEFGIFHFVPFVEEN